MTSPEGRGFTFLFRTDQGVIDKATWWRGTLPLLLIAVVGTVGWRIAEPFTHDAIHQPPALAVFGYLYLLAFSFGILLLLICEYNLSAKRFAALGRPRALASVLPLTLLGAGAAAWYIPRSSGALPSWSLWPALAIVAAVMLWNVVELEVDNAHERRADFSGRTFAGPHPLPVRHAHRRRRLAAASAKIGAGWFSDRDGHLFRGRHA